MTTTPIYEEKQQDIFELEQLADKELKDFSKLMTFDTASIQILRNRQRYQIGAFGFSKDNNPRLLRGIDHDEQIKPSITEKKIIIEDDVDDKNERYWNKKETPKVRSWICAPLIVDDEVIGLLTIDHYLPKQYSYKKHGKLVKDFARDVAGRIKQWLSLHESKRRAEQLESLIILYRTGFLNSLIRA